MESMSLYITVCKEGTFGVQCESDCQNNCTNCVQESGECTGNYKCIGNEMKWDGRSVNV